MSSPPPQTITPEMVAAASPEEKRRLLAQLLQNKAATSRSSNLQPRPLSDAQRRIYLLGQMAHVGSSYNIPFVMDLRGRLDVSAMQASLKRIIERHEILRTRFTQQDGEPVQQVGAAYDVDLQPRAVPRLKTLGNAIDEYALQSEHAELCNRVIDLASGQLLWTRLWALGVDHHRLLVAVHHIAFDGWSISVLSRELSALYGAFCKGLPDPLPPLPMQYADYAKWVHEPEQQRSVNDLLQARVRELQNLPVFELPPQRRVDRRGASPAGHVRFSVSKPLSARALEQVRAWNTTPFVLLLSVFMVLLARRSGQAHVVLGSPVAGRGRAEAELMLGFFVNSMVIQAEINMAQGLASCVARVGQAVHEGLRAQALPFERLVHALQPQRQYSRNPIFQHMFAFQTPLRGPDFSGTEVRLERFELGDTAARFDLEGHAWVESEQIHGGTYYNQDLFSEAFVQQMTQDFVELLAAGLSEPDRALGSIPLGQADASRPVTDRESLPSPSLPEQAPHLPALWSQAVARWPQDLALREPPSAAHPSGREFTYRQWDQVARRVALRLTHAGVGPGDVVALVLPRSLLSTAVILGIALSGAAYMAIDEAQPAQRRATMLGRSGARLVIRHANEPAVDGLPNWAISDDALWSSPSDVDTEAISPQEPAALMPQHPAYLCFTSGSSGEPKGIAIPHQAVVTLAMDRRYNGLEDLGGEPPVVPHLASVAFDATTFELWSTWAAGGCVLVLDRLTVLDPARLTQVLRAGHATLMFVTTALFNRLVEEAPQGLAELHCVMAGGEVPSESAMRRFLDLNPRVRLVNIYGPTETTTFACARSFDLLDSDSTTVPMGGPGDGGAVGRAVLRVVNPQGTLCGPDEVGELLIGGPGLAHGYVGQAALTAERFIPDAWSLEPGSRLYRSGDLVRCRLDGGLEYLGRLDREIKVRGHRIQPAEVERVLRQHPRVTDAAVGLVEQGDARRVLAAYVVEAHEEPVGSSAARGAEALVQAWQGVFDRIYAQIRGNDPLFDITGWNRCDDQQPFTEAQMREWAADVMAHLRNDAAQAVLEVGCGTGMLLFQGAEQSTRYVGVDVSSVCLQSIKARIEQHPGRFDHVQLHRMAAHELDALPEESVGDGFDVVLLSSVSQYFPSRVYLEQVLEWSLAHLRPGGRIIMADVRNEALRALFHADVLAHPAQEVSPQARQAEWAKRMAQDTELFIDPGLFADWVARRRAMNPTIEVSRVGLAAQTLKDDHELSRYRYAAIIRRCGLGSAATAPAAGIIEPQCVRWMTEPLTLSSWEAALTRAIESTPGVTDRNEPHPLAIGWRAQPGGRYESLVEAATATGIEPPLTGIPIQSLRQAADVLGFDVLAAPLAGSRHGLHDIVAVRRRAAVAAEPWPTASGWSLGQTLVADARSALLCNRPQTPSTDLDRTLRQHIAQVLPDYMVPTILARVERIPLNTAGKVDFSGLRTHGTERHLAVAEASTPTQRAVLEVMGELLGRSLHSVQEDFFLLGGHSLLASRLMVRLRERLGVEVPLDLIFRHPRIIDLAQALDELRPAADETRDEDYL